MSELNFIRLGLVWGGALVLGVGCYCRGRDIEKQPTAITEYTLPSFLALPGVFMVMIGAAI